VTNTAAPAPRTEAESDVHTLAEQERHMIAEALRRTKGNKTRAAASLGLSRTQLLRRVRRFGLRV
jgi:transcriptional regulator with PAS, ATPase and Fis domain